MATDVRVIEDTGTVVTNNLTRWPIFETKAEILRALLDAQAAGPGAIFDIAMRLSNTDTGASIVDDKASRLQ